MSNIKKIMITFFSLLLFTSHLTQAASLKPSNKAEALSVYKKHLETLAKQKTVTLEELKKMEHELDGECDKNQSFCDFLSLIQSVYEPLEDKEEDFTSRCENAHVSLESSFVDSFVKEKKELKKIVTKICNSGP